MRSASLLALLLAGCAGYLPSYPLLPDAVPTGFTTDPGYPERALLEYGLARQFARPLWEYDHVCAVETRLNPSDPHSAAVPFPPDVEAVLLARFPGLSPADTCVRDGLDIRNASTGEPAALFDVHELECETPKRCSAWVGYYANGPHSWRRYWIEWRDGEWRIRPRKSDIVVT